MSKDVFGKRVLQFVAELQDIQAEMHQMAIEFIEELGDDELIMLQSLVEVIAERDSEISQFQFIIDWPEYIDQEFLNRELGDLRVIV